MSSDLADKGRSLKEQISRSEGELSGLGDKLRALDIELEALRDKKPHYDAVSQACQSLETLENSGMADLFWDSQHSPDNWQHHIRHAHHNLTQYEAEVTQIADRRESVIESMNAQYDDLDDLQYNLRDVLAAEESRRQEWIVEREADALPPRTLVMPWARGCEEDQRFRQSLAASVLLSLLTGWLLTIIDLPIPERAEIIEVPERVARLVREEMRRPPPVEAEEPAAVPDEPPEPQLAKEQPLEELAEKPQPGLVADAEPAKPREQIKSKGILAFRDSFASAASLRPSAQLGSEARLSSAGEEAVGRTERSMVTTLAPGSSGGINLASLSRDVGGGGGGGNGDGMAGVQVSRVASSIGGGDGAGNGRPMGGGAYAGRTDEEIQIVFDRYKSALYRMYNRELRKDPTLRGQMILRMTIEPDGSVSFCTLQSTDLNAPTLTQQIVDRVSSFDFGAKEDIVAVTIIYPIDFLPAA